MKQDRIEWIDALRALAIFLVVLEHLYEGNNVYSIIVEPILMTMFFFLAGYVLRTDRSCGDFFKRLFLRIYVPYLIFSLLPLRCIWFLLLKDIPGLMEYAAAFFSGRIFWFVPTFLVTQILVYLLYRLCRGNWVRIWAASVVCFVIGVNTADVAWMDFWCLNTALTAVLYMNLGLFLRQSNGAIRVSSHRAMFINALVYLCGVALALRFYPECHLDIHLDMYYNVPLCLMLIVSGILLCVGVSQNIHWGSAAAPWLALGQETFVVYLTHSAIRFVLSKLLRPILPLNRARFWVCLVYAILSCILGTILSKSVGRCFPVLTGISAKKDRKTNG